MGDFSKFLEAAGPVWSVIRKDYDANLIDEKFYDALSEAVEKVLDHDPLNAVEAFPEFSKLISTTELSKTGLASKDNYSFLEYVTEYFRSR